MTLKSKLAAAALCLALPLSAQAHKGWILPSATTLSDHGWVTFDAAVSNDLFYFNHVPIRLDNLQITAPDGSAVTAQNPFTGKYRSVFDLELKQSGTYKIAVANSGLNASYETATGEKKRWRGTAEAFAKDLPKDAKNVEVTQSASRNETFVTSGKPSTTALKATGIGLELVPITHPNDLFAGEKASFKFTIDGKPAADLELEIVPGGSRYRDAQNEMKLTTDSNGLVEITFPSAGMYWLEGALQDDKASVKPATKRRATYVATFEVLPQ